MLNQRFQITCPECSNESSKHRTWFIANPHPMCAVCGADLTAARNQVVEIIKGSEDFLADDLERLRRGDKPIK